MFIENIIQNPQTFVTDTVRNIKHGNLWNERLKYCTATMIGLQRNTTTQYVIKKWSCTTLGSFKMTCREKWITNIEKWHDLNSWEKTCTDWKLSWRQSWRNDILLTGKTGQGQELVLWRWSKRRNHWLQQVKMHNGFQHRYSRKIWFARWTW